MSENGDMQYQYQYFTRFMILGLLAILLSGCASANTIYLSRNLGDQITARLKLGMTHAEIDVAVVDLKKWIVSDTADQPIRSQDQLLGMYMWDYYPDKALSTTLVGDRYRAITYWTNYAGGHIESLRLFFDERSQRLRGWANYPSEYSTDKFMHEKITSQLTWSGGGVRRGMSHKEVYALIGKPMEIIAAPAKSRAVYEDHFWVIEPYLDPEKQKMEVYSYALSNGAIRRVYLLYYPAADRLLSWGYDHAWEEAERYLHEKGAQQK